MGFVCKVCKKHNFYLGKVANGGSVSVGGGRWTSGAGLGLMLMAGGEKQ